MKQISCLIKSCYIIDHFRRTVSGTSMFTEANSESYPMDEFDKAINTFSEQIATLGSSVDINTDPDIFNPRKT